MSSQDDPFADPGDLDKTVIKPNPGGRRTPQPGGGAPARGSQPGGGQAARPATPRAADVDDTMVQAPSGVQAPPGRTPAARRGAGRADRDDPGAGVPAGPAVPIAQVGINPLVTAASSLLGLAIRLRNRATHRNIESLRDRVIAEIKGFETRAAALGVAPPSIRAGRYALCATIDDLVQNTPWGSQAGWAKQSMVKTFHGETWGGERFFEVLDQLNKNIGRNFEVLELMYLCLTLGFEGQYRVLERGSARHAQVRAGLYRTIRQRRGEYEREISPHWRGLEGGHRPLSAMIPIWVIGVITAALLTFAFMGFTFALGPESGRIYGLLSGLQPRGAVELVRAAPTPQPDQSQARLTPTPVQAPPVEPRMARFLEPEVRQGLVNVEESPDQVRITLNAPGRGMFRPASATVIDSYLPVIDRVGQALEAEPGSILVVGHTDIDPISTLQFPNNVVLSQRRAESVLDLLARQVTDRRRMTAEGRGATEPLPGIDGTTPEGKRLNRRVEIIFRPAASR